eukprot:m.27721 g.27721  ORF g.27721 m.27721 type:complete len:64 (-) comp15795_c0_seq1:216-407(-)
MRMYQQRNGSLYFPHTRPSPSPTTFTMTQCKPLTLAKRLISNQKRRSLWIMGCYQNGFTLFMI